MEVKKCSRHAFQLDRCARGERARSIAGLLRALDPKSRLIPAFLVNRLIQIHIDAFSEAFGKALATFMH